VDHVTPGGQLPAQTSDLTGMLQKFMSDHGLPT
jgi:uncharacterized protein YidB (DUF937 family)